MEDIIFIILFGIAYLLAGALAFVSGIALAMVILRLEERRRRG